MRHADRLTRILLTTACAVLAAVLLWSIRNAIILSRHGDGNPNTGLTREEYEAAMDQVNLREDKEFGQWLKELCQIYEVDYYIVRAIIGAESGWDPRAVNERSGAAGLMQIVPGTWEAMVSLIMDEYGVEYMDPLNPKDNVRVGVNLLHYLYGRYDDILVVLDCYALGEGGAAMLGEHARWAQYIVKRADELRRADLAQANADAVKVKDNTKEVIA